MRVRVATVESVTANMQKLAQRVGDIRPIARSRINPDLDRFFTRQFDTKGAAGGEPWAPLSANTVRARGSRESRGRARFESRRGRARGGLFAVLWDTGRARASLVKVGPESVLVMQPMQYERGSTVPYLAMHMTGYKVSRWGSARFPARNVPARRIVPTRLPIELVQGWEAAFASYIGGA